VPEGKLVTIYEPTTRTVERIPDLRNKPLFREPWRLSGRPVDPHWWRIDAAGTIYRVELPSGDVRRF
jgi:hypothetical protein